MQTNPNDRHESRQQPQSKRWGSLLLACLVIAGIVYFVVYKSEKAAEQASEIVQIAEIQPAEVIAPQIEKPVTVEKIPEVIPEASPEEELNIELPTLDDSDPLIREKIAALSSTTDFLPWFKSEHIIRRGVTLTSGLSDGAILSKLANIPTPKGRFLAQKEGDHIWLDSKNYGRYSYFVNAIISIDSTTLIKIYHQFRPLLEQAYAELGYAESSLDTAIVGAFDQLLSAPLLDGAIELKLESVAYTFANPELEKLPPVQKLLIRMGPENTEQIQQKVRELRNALLSESGVLGR